jgi:hypothetical protein
MWPHSNYIAPYFGRNSLFNIYSGDEPPFPPVDGRIHRIYSGFVIWPCRIYINPGFCKITVVTIWLCTASVSLNSPKFATDRIDVQNIPMLPLGYQKRNYYSYYIVWYSSIDNSKKSGISSNSSCVTWKNIYRLRFRAGLNGHCTMN